MDSCSGDVMVLSGSGGGGGGVCVWCYFGVVGGVRAWVGGWG